MRSDCAVCIMFGLKPPSISAAQRAKMLALGILEGEWFVDCFCSVGAAASFMLSRCTDADDTNGYWALAKSALLNDPKEFLRKLLEYDKNALDERTIMAIQVGIPVVGYFGAWTPRQTLHGSL